MSDKLKNMRYINHDVNNHLGVALGYFELLLDKRPELKNDPHAVRSMAGIQRARELSKDLALACTGTTDQVPDKEGFMPISVQDHLIKYTNPAYEKLRKLYDIGINVICSAIKEEKFIYINPENIARIRENIVSNAIDAGATRLDVNIEMKEYCVVVTFRDNGRGMSQDEIDRLILSQHGDGLIHGVGTTSILETVKDHGYYVSYSSEEGKGTTIRALVPYMNK